jgi:hypothetical protein
MRNETVVYLLGENEKAIGTIQVLDVVFFYLINNLIITQYSF